MLKLIEDDRKPPEVLVPARRNESEVDCNLSDNSDNDYEKPHEPPVLVAKELQLGQLHKHAKGKLTCEGGIVSIQTESN